MLCVPSSLPLKTSEPDNRLSEILVCNTVPSEDIPKLYLSISFNQRQQHGGRANLGYYPLKSLLFVYSSQISRRIEHDSMVGNFLL